MLKKLLLAVATLIATMGFAFAQVDVNKADQAALDSVKGIGPKTSKAILDERKKGGEFKDWADFEKRVKGVGGKSSEKMSEAGLTVNGQPKPKTSAVAKDDKKDKSKADAAKKADAGKDTKTTAAQDAKPAASSGGSDAKATDAKGAKKDTKKEEPKK
jgi:competence protein ComEA